MSQLYHGGALDKAIAQYGGEVQNWLDLSTGINPYHYPIKGISLKSYTQLPQQADLAKLIDVARHAYNCEKGEVLVGNGTQILIENLPKIFAKSTIAILAPTYEEHAKNWQKNGHKVVLTDDIETAKTADHLLIVNPNNPTGKLFTRAELMALHAYFAKKNGYLIVDEAFIDCQPEFSLAGKAGIENLIILRSFGKFYGLAGVRIGFLLSSKNIVARMQAGFGLWGIAGCSMQLATKALLDDVWQQKMCLTLQVEMQEMQEILLQNGFKTIGSTALFCLVKMPNTAISAYKYYEKLCESHILSRKFEADDTILRFGLVEDVSKNKFQARLRHVLLELNI